MKCSTTWQKCPANQKKKDESAEKQRAFHATNGSSERMLKRAQTLSKIDESGVSGFKRNALAIAASRRQSDGSYRGIDKTVKTKRTTKIDGKDLFVQAAIKTATTRFGVYAGLEGKTDFEKYRYRVILETNKQPLFELQNIEKRAAFGKTPNPYQLDHEFSISQGFLNNIPPYIIGHISNLRMIPSKENNSKGSKCSITKDELFRRFFAEQTPE